MAEKRVSVYKYQFVSPPPDDVICPLCLDIVEEPHQFTCCGQHICKKCGDKLKQQDSSSRCPMCRHSECTMSPDKYFERNVLKKLQIWCTEGCGQKVQLGQLKNHLPKCPCVQKDCPYGCSQQYRRQYIEEHKKKCPKRPFICGYCKYQSTYEVIVNEHYPVCDKYPIICPNECSGDKIERGMLQDHLDKCPFQVVECEFSHVGCQEKVRRCDLVQHLSDNSVHHSALSSKMIYESLQKMMEEKDRLLQEKDKLLQGKDKQLLEKDRQLQEKDKKLDLLLLEIHKLGLELRVDKKDASPPVDPYEKVCGDTILSVTIEKATYKKNKRVQWISSPYFTHRHYGYMMRFEVDFNYSHRIGSLAIFSRMISGPYDDILEWPFKGKVIVQLLNQCGDHHHYDYVFDYKDNDRGKRVTSGERGAALTPQGTHLPFDQLSYKADTNCQYLKDDCLKFAVSVLLNKDFADQEESNNEYEDVITTEVVPQAISSPSKDKSETFTEKLKVIGKEECFQNKDGSNDEYEDVITTGAVPQAISSPSKDKSETFTEKLKVTGKEECFQNQDGSNNEYYNVITTGAVPQAISSPSKDKSETFTEKLKVTGKEECLQKQDESDIEYYNVITTGAVPQTIPSPSTDKSETFRKKLKESNEGGKKAKALHDFQAEEFDEISFKIGDIIEKIEEVDDDWCIGEINGKRGMFPITFVKII